MPISIDEPSSLELIIIAILIGCIAKMLHSASQQIGERRKTNRRSSDLKLFFEPERDQTVITKQVHKPLDIKV